MNPKQAEMYARFLGHLESDPFFLGYILAVFRLRNNLDDARLAEFLRCTDRGLARLKACTIPDPTQRSFQENIERIASYADCDPNQLLTAIRQVQVLDALRSAPEATGTAAMAARDRRGKRGD